MENHERVRNCQILERTKETRVIHYEDILDWITETEKNIHGKLIKTEQSLQFI